MRYWCRTLKDGTKVSSMEYWEGFIKGTFEDGETYAAPDGCTYMRQGGRVRVTEPSDWKQRLARHERSRARRRV